MGAAAATLAAGLAGQIFLGQAYPGGSVYLRPFDQTNAVGDVVGQELNYERWLPPLAAWPVEVSLWPLRAGAAEDKEVGGEPRLAIREAYYQPILKREKLPGSNDERVIYDSIPAREGTDEYKAASCGLSYKVDKTKRYAKDDIDLFQTMSDHCVVEEVVALYASATPTKTASYTVIGFAKDLKVTNVVYGKKDEKRPAQPAEAEAIAKARKAAAKEECTTEPAYLDDARVLFTAKIAGGAKSVRVSSYTTPGCGGHLATIYVMDLLEGGKVTARYEITQYQGVI